jgi:1-acyl-sn-glycerol-3-phosphate acyltransferase
MKDPLRSIGTAGEPGRGSRSASPSAAARSLAGASSRPARKVSKPSASSAKAAPAPDPTPASGEAKPSDYVGDRATVTEEIGFQQVKDSTAQRGSDEGFNGDGVPTIEDLWKMIADAAQRLFGLDWEARLRSAGALIGQRFSGDYEVDDFGYDKHIAELLDMVLDPIAEKWFRLEVRGIENIPTDGGALLVSNHSGTIPVDGLICTHAIRKHTGRALRMLGADLVFKLPVISPLARSMGATLACAEDAERLLSSGELVGVWPEGFKGVGKPFSERYKLQRFGRGGFVSAAVKAQVPIVPVSIVGAEEIYPLIGNVPSVARMFGLPYLPITPFFPWLGPLGAVPLPSKWIIQFGETVRTDTYAPESADDPMLLFNVTDQVRESIQQSLYTLLLDRGNPFF